MSWSANTPTTSRSTARARSTPVKASSSTARPWRAGSAVLPPSSVLCTSVCSSTQRLAQAVHGRDPGAGARPGAQANQDRLPLGDRPRRPTLGRHRPAGGRLSVRARSRRRACHPAARGVQGRSPGRRLRGLQRPGRSRSRWRSGDACLLLEPRPAPVLRDRPGRQRPDRGGGSPAHRRALCHRAHDPRRSARAAPQRALGPDQAAHR